MTDDERVRKLEIHWCDTDPYELVHNPTVAKAHMDALVEAGVVEFINVPVSQGAHSDFLYRIAKPHVHEPYVKEAVYEGTWVTIGCLSCNEKRDVPRATLPIEWPDE
jgi:hypothetical protein